MSKVPTMNEEFLYSNHNKGIDDKDDLTWLKDSTNVTIIILKTNLSIIIRYRYTFSIALTIIQCYDVFTY